MIHPRRLIRWAAFPAAALTLLAATACAPVVTIPPELLATPTATLPEAPPLAAAVSCEQLPVSFLGGTCQEGGMSIDLDLGRPLADLGQVQVTGNGSLLGCAQVPGAPNLVRCTGPALQPEARVVLTVCPGGCAPTAACEPGRYFDRAFRACLPIPGAPDQPTCPSGYTWDPGTATCLQTGGGPGPLGDKVLAALRVVVASCEAGQYWDADNAACQPCPPGYWCDGTLMPQPCPAGSTSGPGSGSCTPCPPGTFSGDGGSATCSPCPAGTYNADSGQTGCLSCPPGSVSHSGQPACYALATATPAPTPTPSCPDGFVFEALYQTCLPTSGPTSPTCTSLVIRLPACP